MYEDVSETQYIGIQGNSYYLSDFIFTNDDNQNIDHEFDLFPGNPLKSCVTMERPIIAFVGPENEIYTELRSILLSPRGSIFLNFYTSQSFIEDRTKVL